MGDDELTAGLDDDGDSKWRDRLRPRNVALVVVGLLVLFVAWQVVAGLRSKPGQIRDARGELRVMLLREQGVDVHEEQLSAAQAEAIAGKGWTLLLASVGVMQQVIAEAEAELLQSGVIREEWESSIGVQFAWPIDGAAIYAPDGANEQLIELTRRGITRFTELGGDALLDEMLASPVVVRAIQDGSPDESLLHLLFEELRYVRQMTKIAVAAMHESALRGEADEAAAWCRRALGIGGVYTRHATIIEHLVGQALISLVAERVRVLALSGELDGPTSEALLKEFNRFKAMSVGQRHGGMGSIASALRGEKIVVMEIIDRVHTESGRLIPSELNKLANELSENPSLQDRIERMPIINITSIFYPTKSQTIAAAEKFYGSVIGPMESREGEAEHAGFDPLAYMNSLPRTQVVLYMMLPAIDRAISSSERSRRQVEVARLALAAAVYHHRSGAWPTDAMDLVGTVLDEPVREPVQQWQDPADGDVIDMAEVLTPATRR